MSEEQLKALTGECLEVYQKAMERAMSFEKEGYPDDELYSIHKQSTEIVNKRLNDKRSSFNETLFNEYNEKLKNLIEKAFKVFKQRNHILRGRGNNTDYESSTQQEFAQCRSSESLHSANSRNGPGNRSSSSSSSEQTATADNPFSNIETIGTAVAGAAAIAAAAFFGYKAYSNRKDN